MAVLAVLIMPVVPWAPFVLDFDPKDSEVQAGADSKVPADSTRVAVHDRVAGEFGQANQRVSSMRRVAEDLGKEPASLPNLISGRGEAAGPGLRRGGS
jgi:hypothetical protein